MLLGSVSVLGGPRSVPGGRQVAPHRLWRITGGSPASPWGCAPTPPGFLGMAGDVPGGSPGYPQSSVDPSQGVDLTSIWHRSRIDPGSIQDRSNVRYACFERSMGFSPLEPRWSPRVNSAYGSAAQADRLLNPTFRCNCNPSY